MEGSSYLYQLARILHGGFLLDLVLDLLNRAAARC